MKSVQVRTRGEGGPKLAILLRTYFMDAPFLKFVILLGFGRKNF